MRLMNYQLLGYLNYNLSYPWSFNLSRSYLLDKMFVPIVSWKSFRVMYSDTGYVDLNRDSLISMGVFSWV